MPLFAAAIVLAFFSSISMGVQTSLSQGLDLVLPTDNDALFSGDGAAFYQYVERNYKGVKSTPWEGGRYGFVRDPTDTAGGVVYTRFHEGIDIRPLQRHESRRSRCRAPLFGSSEKSGADDSRVSQRRRDLLQGCCAESSAFRFAKALPLDARGRQTKRRIVVGSFVRSLRCAFDNRAQRKTRDPTGTKLCQEELDRIFPSHSRRSFRSRK